MIRFRHFFGGFASLAACSFCFAQSLPDSPASGAGQVGDNSSRPKVTVACPGYVQHIRPLLESEYKRVQISGVMRVRLVVTPNGVQDVLIDAGPDQYSEAVKKVLMSLVCHLKGSDQVMVRLDLSFQ